MTQARNLTGATAADADMHQARQGRLMRLATYASVFVAGLLIVVKAGAWFMTGSTAMLGTLVDSILDAVASVVNLLAVRHALTPADEEHRFGHGKAEALAGLGQAAVIAGSAVFLGFESVRQLVVPTPVTNSAVGIAVTVFAIVVTFFLVTFQRYVVKRTSSVAITADSLHYAGDLLLNGGVIVAIVLSGVLGIYWADPVIAFGIAVYIGWNAARILRSAYDQLMDRELPDEQRDRIKDIAMNHEGVLSLHDLRTRASGTNVFIQVHLEMEPQLSLLKAHEIADEVEAALNEAFPGAEVIIHQDPAGIGEEPAFDA